LCYIQRAEISKFSPTTTLESIDMSGGHFDHKQWVMHDIAETIELEIEQNDSNEKNEYGECLGNHYPPEVIDKFKEAEELLCKAYDMVRCIDYLLSGDTGPDSFLQSWKDKVDK